MVSLLLVTIINYADNPDDRDAEARVNAFKGLVSVCETLTEISQCSDIPSGEDCVFLFSCVKNEVMHSLFTALDDYSVDNRGDVGSWVHEATMDGLERCTYILFKGDSMGISSKLQGSEFVSEGRTRGTVEDDKIISFFDASLATNLVGGLVKHAVEKMDRLRELAATSLQRILYNRLTFVPFIPFREKLEEIVPNEANLK